jgi:succinate dehydrogenase/fumarate reductase flavoprotein subunit
MTAIEVRGRMNMREIESDVLVIGSGAAGVMAALRAARTGCGVILASKGSMRTGNSTLAGGGWLVPSREFPPDAYFNLVMEAGKQLNDAQLVRMLALYGEGMIRGLRELGAPVERQGERYWFVQIGRSTMFPGMIFMDALWKRIKAESILTMPWLSITELLEEEGRISGAVGVSKTEGPVIIDAKSVVLATGGAGGIYRRHDNHRRILGDGYWLALGMGLSLRDMEFIQWYPLTLAEPHLPSLIIDEPFPEEVKAVDSRGQDLMKKHRLLYNLNESVMGHRDQFTLILSRELEKGPVYLDYTAVPREKWESPPLNRLGRMNPAFRDRPISVAPAVHFFMGGVEIDQSAQTAIPGLFAAGEVTSGVHGANRMGGNALTECVVFGDIAGESAARYAMRKGRGKWRHDTIRGGFSWKDETKRAREFLHQVQDLMWVHAGPIRSKESLQEGLFGLSDVEQRVSRLEPMGRSVELNEVKGTVLVSKAIMRASIERKESRGAFYREDFPQRDDGKWLKNILLRLDKEAGDFVVSYKSIEADSR